MLFRSQDTIRANLLYGCSDRESSDFAERDLWQSLEIVNMDHFVRSLPGGLDTVYKPLDANLSGGQIQRLVISRALLRSPKILLLDEATSAVDVANELDITKRLIDHVKVSGRVLIAVTHRLQWLSLYDEIWFVEHGRVSLRGRHTDLILQIGRAHV